jgi:putative nucleotidyltransferase with HDIG domain
MKTHIHVLIIADHDKEATQLLKVLQAHDYTLTMMRVNSVTQLEHALSRPTWELALVFYPLDQFHGFDAVSVVRTQRPEMPCIVLSHTNTAEVAVAAMKVGARDYIVVESEKTTAAVANPHASEKPLVARYPRLVPALKRELREVEARRTRHQVAQETRRQAASAEALVQVAMRLNQPLDLPAVAQAVCEEVVEHLRVSAASIMVHDTQPNRWRLAGSAGLTAQSSEHFSAVASVACDEWAHTHHTLRVIPDTTTHEHEPLMKAFAALNARTIASVAILREGERIGHLFLLTFKETREFSASELFLLQGIATQAAQAISHASLFASADRRLAQMQALRTVDLAITASLDLRLTLNVLLDQVLAQLKIDAVEVRLLNAHTNLLEYAAGRGFKTRAPQQTPLRLGQELAGRAALEQRTLSIPNLIEVTGDLSQLYWLKMENFNAQYAVPLIAKGQVKGVLSIFHRASLAPDSEWFDFMEALASQAAIAIDNATLFQNLQRSNAELALAYDATIEGWSRVLDLRDKETEGHSRRVTEMMLQLARALGFSEQELVHVRRGALLHDIGKMGVPDGILLKEGPLDDAEAALMRKHPEFARAMLYPIVYLRPALDIPYCHHEKWDGTGYPRGLNGEQIPLAARIFSVVDVWDALRSDRPYRKGLEKETVRAHIQERAGKDFDPHVVEMFLQLQIENDF